MGHVSRPLLGLLVAAVALFAVWFVALKPTSTTNAGSPPALAPLSAVGKARKAVATADAASAAHGGTIVTMPTAPATPTDPAPAWGASTAAPAATKPAVSSAASAASSLSPAANGRLGVVQRALRTNKVIALLFYNAAAADDRAVKRELDSVPSSGGRVVKLAVPLRELARYTVVTSQVPVDVSPTLVLVDRDQQATTIVGFADRVEIAQRVADALAVN